MSLGTGLGSPASLTLELVLALVSLIVLLSPAAKVLSLDAALVHPSPRLVAVLLTGRRTEADRI